MMDHPEPEIEECTCGGQHDHQQDCAVVAREDGDGENLWDTFRFLQVDAGCESTRDRFTENESWCSVRVAQKRALALERSD